MARKPHRTTANLPKRKRWASRVTREEVRVEIFNQDEAQAIEIGGEHGHGCAEKRGEEESGDADRHLRDHVIGKNLIGAGDGGGKRLAGEAVKGPEQGADEHEGGPHGQAERCAHGDATQSGAVGFGGEVALHHGLIGGVFL